MALDNFISQIKSGGLARTNRFTVQFELPPTVRKSKGSNNLRKILLFCDSAQLPGINLSTTQSRIFGEFREMPYERLFDPVSLSFYVDSEMLVKVLLDDWINSIQDTYTRDFNYYKDYTTSMVINVYDVANNLSYACVLDEAYPKVMSSVSLDYASREMMKLPITIQYRNWRAVHYGSIKSPEESKFMSSNLPTAVAKLRQDIYGFAKNKIVPDSYFNNFEAYQGRLNDFNNSFQNGVLQVNNSLVDNGISSSLSI